MVQNDCCTKVNNNASRRCTRQCRTVESGNHSQNGMSNGSGHIMAGSFSVPADTVNLKRRVGLFSGVALIVGTMIGSGIFISPSDVLRRTGSVALSLLIWTGCGIMSLLGALAYAELGTMNHKSGAEYHYFLDAFGNWPAFLFSWVSTLVLKPSQLAIICLTFAQYFVEAFTEHAAPQMSIKLVAIATIALLLFINCYSVNLATGIQNVFTAAKLFALLIICSGAVYKISNGPSATVDFTSFEHTDSSVGGVAMAFYSGLWAYDGWNNLNYATEEIKNPNRNLPLAILIGIPLTTISYLLILISYLVVMTPEQMTDSNAVAVTFADGVLGSWEGAQYVRWVIPICVAISTFGAANGTLFVAGRLCFATSREGQFSDILSYIHVRRFTPIPALVFHAIIAAMMVIAGNIESLVDFFSFTAWIFYGGAMLALIVQRFTRPNFPRPYKVWIIVPIFVLMVSIYLVLAPIIDKPQWEYLYASLFIFAGLLVYIPFVYGKKSCPCMVPVTIFLQKLFQVAPTEVLEEERCFL